MSSTGAITIASWPRELTDGVAWPDRASGGGGRADAVDVDTGDRVGSRVWQADRFEEAAHGLVAEGGAQPGEVVGVGHPEQSPRRRLLGEWRQGCPLVAAASIIACVIGMTSSALSPSVGTMASRKTSCARRSGTPDVFLADCRPG